MEPVIIEECASWPMGRYMPLPVSDGHRERGEKLLDYAQKECRTFYQIDGWHLKNGDSFFHPDDDGDCVTMGFTDDLMSGTEVRVLIGTQDHKTAVRLLEKALSALKSRHYEFDGHSFREWDLSDDDDAPHW